MGKWVSKDMKKVPFILVTGFLGSGKTTFLKRLIDQFGQKQKIGIIQNEFAPGSIDGTELKNTGKPFEILEVNNGSVFCVCLLGSFVKSLDSFLQEHEPDIVILEASGLSDPISIGEMLQGPDLSNKLYLSRIWCFVDASNFEKLGKGFPRIQHQVRVADSVVINKTDLESRNTDKIREWIKYLNPFASIETAAYSNVPVNMDFQSGRESPAVSKENVLSFSMPGGGRPDFDAFVIKSTRPISNARLEEFLSEVSPETSRIKGFVRLDGEKVLAVQSCFGDTKLVPVEGYTGPTELIFVGRGIDRLSFEKKLNL